MHLSDMNIVMLVMCQSYIKLPASSSLLLIDCLIVMFFLSDIIPFNVILYFISATVSCSCPADTMISIKAQDGWF